MQYGRSDIPEVEEMWGLERAFAYMGQEEAFRSRHLFMREARRLMGGPLEVQGTVDILVSMVEGLALHGFFGEILADLPFHEGRETEVLVAYGLAAKRHCPQGMSEWDPFVASISCILKARGVEDAVVGLLVDPS